MTLLTALACLSLNGYHEARGEPFLGQIAVAQVVLRRADHDPRRVCREIRRPHQFSWTRHRLKVRNRAAWREAQLAARTAMLHMIVGSRTDHSNGADHYHASYVSPSWARSMEEVARIGEHHFFKDGT